MHNKIIKFIHAAQEFLGRYNGSPSAETGYMRRSTIFVVLVTGIALCAACDHPVVDKHNAAISSNDAAEIYGKFINSWNGKRKDPINVSIKAETPSSKDVEQFSECVHGDKGVILQWLPANPVQDLSNSIGKLSYVRLVDPEKWEQHDPGHLIAQGQAVESAVESGFNHGLLRLSAIAFDKAHENAAFTYSFVCGGLCGSGGAVIFRKTQSGWVQNERQCGGWIS